MQQTDFAVELVIGEDCSTDGTRAIVRALWGTLPGANPPALARAQPRERMPNSVAALKACRGQYIALCEGDDYWTDPLKLQKQVDFLEAHPECAICFHNVTVVYTDQRLVSLLLPAGSEGDLHVEDLLVTNFIPTCSVIYRRGLFGEIPLGSMNCP